jgi:hypothetical protein
MRQRLSVAVILAVAAFAQPAPKPQAAKPAAVKPRAAQAATSYKTLKYPPAEQHQGP